MTSHMSDSASLTKKRRMQAQQAILGHGAEHTFPTKPDSPTLFTPPLTPLPPASFNTTIASKTYQITRQHVTSPTEGYDHPQQVSSPATPWFLEDGSTLPLTQCQGESSPEPESEDSERRIRSHWSLQSLRRLFDHPMQRTDAGVEVHVSVVTLKDAESGKGSSGPEDNNSEKLNLAPK